MKKLLIAFSLALMTTLTLADIGKVGRSTSFDNAGTYQTGSREKFEIVVKNQSGGALEDGDLVIWDVSNDDGYSVTTSTTAGAKPACVLSEACAAGAACKCQTYGYKSNVNFDVTNESATAGDCGYLSESNAGKVQGEQLSLKTVDDVCVGIFYDAAAASGDVEMFLKLR